MFAGLLRDELGNASTKRLVGLLCTVTLCGAVVASCAGHTPDLTLSGEVLLLGMAALGLTTIDKRNPKGTP